MQTLEEFSKSTEADIKAICLANPDVPVGEPGPHNCNCVVAVAGRLATGLPLAVGSWTLRDVSNGHASVDKVVNHRLNDLVARYDKYAPLEASTLGRVAAGLWPEVTE